MEKAGILGKILCCLNLLGRVMQGSVRMSSQKVMNWRILNQKIKKVGKVPGIVYGSDEKPV